MHEGTSSFLKLFSCLSFGAGLLWFIFAQYGPDLVIVTLCLVAGTIFFIGGALLSHSIQKSTLNEVTKFAAKDAITDRYRMQSVREVAKAHTYTTKADEGIRLVEAKQRLRLLGQKEQPQEDTFWEANETVDLKDWN